jgi:molybdenum cofactor guanylyltransferase
MNCYVLAGGRSSRMGAPKATLPFAGSTFLGRVVEAAEAVFDRVAAVVPFGAQGVRGVETLFENPHADEAPVFGVQRALEDARAKCFILAVDYPLITSALLADLAERFEASPAAMLVPHCDGYPHVLCAGYSPMLLPVIEARIASRQYDLRALATGAEVVPCEGFELMNVNTPEEREEAERLYERQRLLTSR